MPEQKKRTMSQARDLLKSALADAVTPDKARRLADKLVEMALDGAAPAIAMVFDRLLGKPSVGGAAAVVDEAAADAYHQKLANLSPDEILLAYELQRKLEGGKTPPDVNVYVLNAPDGVSKTATPENDNVIEHRPEGGAE